MQIYRNRQLIFKDTENKIHYVYSNEIYYIEARNRRNYLVTKEEEISVSIALKELEPALPPQFLRIHRGIIINLYHLKEIFPYSVRLRNGAVLTIPEKKYIETQRKIQERLEK